MMSGTLEKYLKYLYLAAMFVMAFTGFGQMPIMRRYYINEVPGLGWTADFYIGLKIHYYAAMVLLFILFYLGTGYLISKVKSSRLSLSGTIRAVLLAVVTLSGAVLMLDNLAGVSLSQNTLIVMDLVHMGGVMVFLVYALVCLIKGSGWLKPAA